MKRSRSALTSLFSRLALATACGGALGGMLSTTVAQAESEEDRAVVTFTGLRVYDDGSSTLVVSLTRRTPVEFSPEGNNVTFLMAGAKVRWRNNKNPLLAEYFKSNVLRAKLDDTREGVTLDVKLRENVRPQHNMGETGNGALLRIDVPAPSTH